MQGRENSEHTDILQDTHERACSQSMRIVHSRKSVSRRVARKETTTILQNTTTDTKRISHTKEEQNKPPPWWKETGSPRVLLLCRLSSITQI
jgi:hypothetical protein